MNLENQHLDDLLFGVVLKTFVNVFVCVLVVVRDIIEKRSVSEIGQCRGFTNTEESKAGSEYFSVMSSYLKKMRPKKAYYTMSMPFRWWWFGTQCQEERRLKKSI